MIEKKKEPKIIYLFERCQELAQRRLHLNLKEAKTMIFVDSSADCNTKFPKKKTKFKSFYFSTRAIPLEFFFFFCIHFSYYPDTIKCGYTHGVGNVLKTSTDMYV